MDTRSTVLIGVREIKQRYGIGRMVAKLLIKHLPHVKIGKRYLVFAGDVDKFIKAASEQGLDIPAYLREQNLRKNGDVSGGEK